MIIEISVSVIAVAFVALVIYLIVMIRSLQVTLKDVQRKSQSLNPLCKTVENVGEILEHKTNALKNEVKAKAESTSRHRLEEEKLGENDSARVVADIVELTGIGMRLWQNLKKRR